MVFPYQVRQQGPEGPAGIVPVAEINEAIQKPAGPVTQGFQKALDTSNRDMVLWIRELRRRLFLTQSDFAQLVGVMSHMVSAWERGDVRPNTAKYRDPLARIGAQYNMPPLPAAGEVIRYHGGPYFPSTLEKEFQAHFGGQAAAEGVNQSVG